MENPRDNPRDKPKDKSKDMPKDKPKEKDGKSKSEDHFIFNSTDNIDYAEFNDTTSSRSPIDGAKSCRTDDKPESRQEIQQPRAHCYKELDTDDVLVKKSRSNASIVMDKKTLKTLIKKGRSFVTN